MKYTLGKYLVLSITMGFLLGPSIFGQGQSVSCDLLITAADEFIDGHGNAANIGPGDTVCLSSGTRSFLWIRYLHGTAEAPIVIINNIGPVDVSNFYYGIKIDSCSHVKLSGKGVAHINYGIRIHDISGGGVSIEGLSTDIEVEGLEITEVELAGIFAKSDPDCDFLSTRDKYVFRNLSIHDNYVHHTGMEGFYIGSSFYEGKELYCNGKDTLVYPHLIKGVKVYNNRIDHAGWDGIQVSSSDSSCYIYNNDVSYDSDSEEYNQMSGILIGGGSKCDCYNNVIIDGKGVGINVFGLGDQSIYNNLIVRAGRTFFDEYPLMSGIYVGEVVTTPGKGYLMAYNTIISPKVFGIHFANTISAGNIAGNNIVMDPGTGFFDGSNFQTINNLTFEAMDPEQFVDSQSNNFDLVKSSTAVNTAAGIPQFELDFDLLERSRPYDIINDIGAYECHDSTLWVNPHVEKQLLRLTVDDTDLLDLIRLSYTMPYHGIVRITLYDMSGNLISTIVDEQLAPASYHKNVDVTSLKQGIYIFRMMTESENISKKFHLFK